MTRHGMPQGRFPLTGLVVGSLLVAVPVAPEPPVWGAYGHEMIGRMAAQHVPESMPAFFRGAVDQLAYLNVEPDRWRDRTERVLDPAMDGNYSPGHYINYEVVPEAALEAPDRLAYFHALEQAGVDRQPGFLPFVILELTQRLRVAFREWREAGEPERGWIEQRIINDAGILGHYVADGSNPLHTTVHYNGWVGDNPNGYATLRGTHARIEIDYVRAQVLTSDLAPLMGDPIVFDDLRTAVWDYLGASHDLVEQLYQIDREARFDGETTAAANKAFITGRLAAGAAMLRDLWWTVWVTSEPDR